MTHRQTKGVLYAVTAYFLWGIFPVYWKLLQTVPAYEILCHRIIWSFLFLSLALLRSVATGGSESFYAPPAYALLARFHQKTRALAMSVHQAALYVGVMTSGLDSAITSVVRHIDETGKITSVPRCLGRFVGEDVPQGGEIRRGWHRVVDYGATR